ncbi:MAG: protein kinase [Polyangiaceae bacterium]
MTLGIEPAAMKVEGMVGPGQVLGRYELLMPVAAGGMAMVWAARLKGSRGFQKIVAVKTMLPKLSEEVQFEQMFLDEASLASQIRHPHVVEILDLGEQDGVLFLVMEWIRWHATQPADEGGQAGRRHAAAGGGAHRDASLRGATRRA